MLLVIQQSIGLRFADIAETVSNNRILHILDEGFGGLKLDAIQFHIVMSDVIRIGHLAFQLQFGLECSDRGLNAVACSKPFWGTIQHCLKHAIHITLTQ